jgi:hypothetical protein
MGQAGRENLVSHLQRNSRIGICALADRIDSFFKDKERVLLAIKSGIKLLPGPTEKNEGALSP